MEYYRVNALAGAGKTYQAENVAVEVAILKHKTIIAVPSKLVAKQVEQSLLLKRGRHGFKITRIDSSNSGHVGKNIADHLTQTAAERKREGEILIITHAGFVHVPHWHCADLWSLIVDECPQSDFNWRRNLPEMHHLLTEHIQTLDGDGSYTEVVPKDGHKAMLDRMAQNQLRDSIWALVADLAGKIISPHWRVHANVENFHRTLSGNVEPLPHDQRDGAKYPLWFFGQMLPSMYDRGFRDVTIMGACFADSLLYKQWSAMGIDFKDHPKISGRLRYHSDVDRKESTFGHPNGHLVRISFIVDQHWSRTRAGKLVDGQEHTWLEEVMRLAEQEFAGQEYLYLCNVADETMANAILRNGRAAPHAPHGLNMFKHIDNVIVTAACLPNPQHVRFMANFGITGEELTTAMHRQIVYQTVCRSSIRDLDAGRAVHFIVPDRDTAEWLASFFPGCKIGPLGRIGQIWHGNRKHAEVSSTARSRAHREAKAALQWRAAPEELNELLDGLLRQDGTAPESGPSQEIATDSLYKENPLQKVGMSVEDAQSRRLYWLGTAFRDKYDMEIDRWRLRPLTEEQLIESLRVLAGQTGIPKERQLMLSPSYFIDQPDPDAEARARQGKGPRRRGRHNAVMSGLIILDFEHGHIPYWEIQRLFPGIRMIIHPTHSAEDEFRFHVIILLDRPINAGQYLHIASRFKAILEQKGYAAKARPDGKPYHGLDKSKTMPENVIYLPSAPKNYDAYFVITEGKPLNVDNWCSVGIRAPLPQESIVQIEPNEATEDDALYECQQIARKLDTTDGRKVGLLRILPSMSALVHGGCIDRYRVDEFAKTLTTLPQEEPGEWKDVADSAWTYARSRPPRRPYVRSYWRNREEQEKAFEDRMKRFKRQSPVNNRSLR